MIERAVPSLPFSPSSSSSSSIEFRARISPRTFIQSPHLLSQSLYPFLFSRALVFCCSVMPIISRFPHSHTRLCARCKNTAFNEDQSPGLERYFHNGPLKALFFLPPCPRATIPLASHKDGEGMPKGERV